MPLPDGECPACHADTNDLAGVDENATLLNVTETTQFPEACCTCNQPTGNLVTVRGHGQSNRFRSDTQRQPMLLGFGIFRIFSLLWQSAEAATSGFTSLAVHIPQCMDCKLTKGAIQPQSVDLDRYFLGVVVHKGFAASVKKRNAR